jgi:hypothetical protein
MLNSLINLRIRIRVIRGRLFAKRKYNEWIRMSKPVPPPHVVKQNLIRKYKEKYRITTFIETGTYLGEMIYAQKNNFNQIYSIEIQPVLFKAAQKRFKKYAHITLLNGDSGEVLFKLIPKINERALFWLDGHYSGGITGKSNLNSPIINELKAIFMNNNDHVIIIDDAHCFTGEDDYPSIEELENYLKIYSYQIQITDNAIIAEKF